MTTNLSADGSRHLRRLLFTLAVAALGVSGCGQSKRPKLGEVTGVVRLDGAPLPNARVVFTPVAGPGRASLGTTDAEGRYRLAYLRDIRGANLGTHAVRIRTTAGASDRGEPLPAKYHEKTTLSAQVAPGRNQIDFELGSR